MPPATQTHNPQEHRDPHAAVAGGAANVAEQHHDEHGHGGGHGHAGMKPTARFDWEKKEEAIYMEWVRKQHERGSFVGLHNALTYATWLREQMWGNIDDSVQREMAMSHVTSVEGVAKPRQMGIADRNYRLGKVVWFDEVLLYKKSYPNGEWNKWWEAGSDDNKPPEDIPGHHMKEGRDYMVYRMLITGGKSVDKETVEFFKQFVPGVPEAITDPEKKRQYIEGFAERLARDKMWDMAAQNYAGNCAYRMNRGEAEKWAGAIEPAVLMDQKIGATPELILADFKAMFRDQAEGEKRTIERELKKLETSEQELPNTIAIEHDDKKKATLQKELEKIPAQREHQLDLLDDVDAYLYTLDHRDDIGLRSVVGDNWDKLTVKSQFTTINSVGRYLLEALLPGTAVAMARSRRFQARASRIVGVELDPDSKEGISENSVVITRLSEAMQYQDLLMSALLNRSGIEQARNGEVLKIVQKRLDVYRDYLGLERVVLDLDVDVRGKEWREREQEKLKQQGKLKEKDGKLVSRVRGGANVGEEIEDRDPDAVAKHSSDEEQSTAGMRRHEAGEEGVGGPSPAEAEEAEKQREIIARKARQQANANAQGEKDRQDKEERDRQEREARNRPAKEDQPSYSEMQDQLTFNQHKRDYPPPNWKHTWGDWKSEPPERKKRRWQQYLDKKGLDELTRKILIKNDDYWKDLTEDGAPPEKSWDEGDADVEGEDDDT
ncbi:hypothetical protein HZA86_05715 [Candidatus Uhrbacteria bacterium]|nr:hypothetical protein [Candidatus Uhrbacteria bacterium]